MHLARGGRGGAVWWQRMDALEKTCEGGQHPFPFQGDSDLLEKSPPGRTLGVCLRHGQQDMNHLEAELGP